MDSLDNYRQIIERILDERTRIPYSYGDVKGFTVFDRAQDHYLYMIIGREGIRRVHGCIIHIDIINGKVWIQRDGTEDGVALELEAAGIPKDHIVLGFKSPEIRPHTGYAVA